MANYIIDTNVLINFVREKGSFFTNEFDFRNPKNKVATSIVSIGEIRSFAMVNHWGTSKLQTMENLFKDFRPLNINSQRIFDRYAEIDAFSLSHHPTKKLKSSAQKMGKNDLWIAATASVFNLTLITTDKDFRHLDGEFLKLEWVKPDLIK